MILTRVTVSCDLPEGMRDRLLVLEDAWVRKTYSWNSALKMLDIVFAMEDKGHRKSWLLIATDGDQYTAWNLRFAKAVQMANSTEAAMALWMAWSGSGKGPGLEYWEKSRN